LEVQFEMKILVLGSSGQLGSTVSRYLTEEGIEVVPWDIKRTMDEDLRVYNPDLLDAMNESDFVYYFASDVGGAKYLEKHQYTHRFIRDNMAIMINTFDALKKTNKPFLYTSSQMATLLNSSYGQMKFLGEKMTSDIGGLTVRLWNIYGVEPNSEKSHVITDFIKMAKTERLIKVRTDGEESRQLLFSGDCATCFLLLTQMYDKIDRNQNYHVTSFEWVTVKEVANLIARLTDSEVQYSTEKDKTQCNSMHPPDPYIQKYWRPTTSLETGIRLIYDEIN
jgi:nucleoside-diphosphate-sugar epimerase